jgi:hypothetical protein
VETDVVFWAGAMWFVFSSALLPFSHLHFSILLLLLLLLLLLHGVVLMIMTIE